MNTAYGAQINLPASHSKIPAPKRIGSANGLDLAKIFLARMTKLSAAVGHLVVGPPMSERARYNHTLVEARAKNFEPFVGVWFRPR